MAEKNRNTFQDDPQRKEEEVDIPEDLENAEEVEDSKSNNIQEELEKLRQEVDENRDRMLRIAAESENFKKRMERERDTTLKYAGENILRELLPTVDNLDRALEQIANDDEISEQNIQALVEGVKLTQKGLVGMLEKFEVTPLDSVGEQFDPEVHEALTMEASNEVPAQHVLKEYVKGYKYKDRLLRAAKVVVSNGPAE